MLLEHPIMWVESRTHWASRCSVCFQHLILEPSNIRPAKLKVLHSRGKVAAEMSPKPQASATLDLLLVRRLAECFPSDPWQTISTRTFIAADRNGECYSTWSSAKHLKKVGGVYAILLPTAWFAPARILHLHAPQGSTISYQFTLPDLTGDGYGIAYVGRTADLCQRWRLHLTKGKRKDGGQVKHGLMDCGREQTEDSALRALREHARIIYTELRDPKNCANRDVLEMSLCARFGPPFNIKAER